jgi:hypothetical protein
MATSIVSLALAYVFLGFLLILAVLRSELGTSLKLVLVVLAAGFYVWHYNGLQALRGWPAAQELPQEFEMFARLVVEPDPKRDEQGSIFLWLRDLDGAQPTPRAYRLPYSRDTHREVDDTLREQQQGRRFVGRPAQKATSGAHSAVEFEPVETQRRGLKPGSAD